jgi:hypothetical protein
MRKKTKERMARRKRGEESFSDEEGSPPPRCNEGSGYASPVSMPGFRQSTRRPVSKGPTEGNGNFALSKRKRSRLGEEEETQRADEGFVVSDDEEEGEEDVRTRKRQRLARGKEALLKSEDFLLVRDMDIVDVLLEQWTVPVY